MPRRNQKQKAPERSATAKPVQPPIAEAKGEDGGARDDALGFSVVGIGASAGGLDAFTQLLKALPVDTGMAFVFVQHLAPTHASALAEILSRATTMPVMEVRDEPRVEPNHVYVIPPGQDMVIAGGCLHLQPRHGRGAHHPVDQFFRALAEDRRHQAVGVVLSGTATDGTIGLEAIKAEGGITFAQDDTAQHEGMPHSAIASGCVDFVLSPDAIAREIARIGHHPYAVPDADTRPPIDEQSLAQVLHTLHRATGVDFTHYKFNTLYRRVTRRMVLGKVDDLQDYVRVLQQNPAEVEALYHDILISVTSFFRNPEAFDALKATVFPHAIAGRTRHHDPVRVWSLGCSTGQEAYSLAIAFAEFAEAAGSTVPLQVFATDLVERGVGTARTGVYPKDIAQDVSPERLRRFFVEVDAGYQIAKSIRDVCMFSRHNVLADPPFSRIDLISCRNLLIYLEPVLQQQIVPILHYALKPSGFLWLGGSETIGGFRNLFEAKDARHKIYARKPGPHGAHFPLQHGAAPRTGFTPIAARPAGAGTDLHREADRLLLSRFAPPGVLVSADLDILQYRGDTGPYLAPAPGKASLNLLKMLREGLLTGVRGAILRAGKERAPAREEGLRVRSNGGYRKVAVEVVPIKGSGAKGEDGGGFLVLFDEAAAPAGRTPRASRAPVGRRKLPAASDSDAARLERELSATREHLQSVIEQQEAANEELQSANEEVQSANEELQSVNEEMETSKEEIQSSNEELATVNDELNNRNLELNRLNNDLVNLIGSVQMAIVIVGPDLRIRRFTPAAEKLLNMVPADMGRPLADIRLNLDGVTDLGPLLTEVIDTVSVKECDVRDRHGRWYSLRLRPYRTLDNKIDGVVVMLVDVDAMKRAHEYTKSIVTTVRQPLVVLDSDLRVRTANASFYRAFEVKPEASEGRLLYELGGGQWNIPSLRLLMEQVLLHNNPFNDFEVEHEFERIGRKTMRLSGRRLVHPGDRTPSILLAIEDVTEGKRAEEALREAGAATRRLAGELETIYDTSPIGMLQLDSELRYVRINDALAKMNGIPAADHIGRTVREIVPDIADKVESAFRRILETGEPIVDIELIGETPAQPGVQRTWLQSWYPLRDAGGQIVGLNVLAREITDRKRAEEALRQHAAQFETLLNEVPLGVYLIDADFRIRHVSPTTFQVFGDILDLIGRDFDEVIHILWPKAYADEIVQRFRHTLETGEPYFAPERIEERLDRGVTEIYEWQINRIPLPEGGYGVVCYFRDISAQVQARAAIEESGQRLRFVMDSAPQKIFTATPNGDVDYFNPIWTEFTGLSFEQIRDWGWTQFIHPDDVDENVRLWRHSLDTGEPFQFEHRFRRADGEYRWHISRAVALKDAEGKILMWVGSNAEIHEQRQTADQLRHYATELSEADRRKNEFLAMLAHELRNPLAPIRTAAQILGTPAVPAAAAEKARAVLDRQIQNMTRLIEDLLDVARITQSKIGLQMAPVDLTAILGRAVELVQPRLEELDQELVLALPSEPWYLSGDAVRLEQAFGNLLNNASKFTARGGHIRLSADRTEAPDRAAEAIVRVRDDGIGIPAEMQSTLFDLFTQAGRSPHHASGLGIGLSLVHRVVALHGGRVDVRSAGVNQGSEFVVGLPLLAEVPPVVASEGVPDAQPTQDLPRRILVVDDNLDAAETLADVLRMRTHDVRVVHNGLAALDTAAIFLPQLVFLDIRMEDMDGYEVARRLRQLPGLNGAVIVAVTGFGRDEDRGLAKDAGFDRYITKPLDPAALPALLASLPRDKTI